MSCKRYLQILYGPDNLSCNSQDEQHLAPSTPQWQYNKPPSSLLGHRDSCGTGKQLEGPLTQQCRLPSYMPRYTRDGVVSPSLKYRITSGDSLHLTPAYRLPDTLTCMS